jgi:transcriptional regulator of acetoin/glycerol metabolism
MVTIPPHLFLLTDEEGVTIYLQYPEYMEAALREIGLKEGVSFSFDQLGVNGISMAMERQTIVTVRGPEHDIKLFSDWNCLCIPIRAEGQAVGYLDLSFHHSIDIEFAAVLLCQLAGNIEKRLLKDSPHRKVELVFEAFDRFGLSAREKEAAYGWLLNHSVLRISSEMGITEGTARNLIKKVYRKTKVNDKGQFIKAFGGLVN